MSYYRILDRIEYKKNGQKESQEKQDKTDLKKMFKYTAKKILWLINYSLSFSKKDSGKEIGIKLLGCLVILQCISLSFFIVSGVLSLILMNPFLTIGILILAFLFMFKKEIKVFLNPKQKN